MIKADIFLLDCHASVEKMFEFSTFEIILDNLAR